MERGEDYIFPSQAVFKAVDPDMSGFAYRPLRRRDYNRGYLELLAQLTTVGDIDLDTYNKRFDEMMKAGTYCIIVAYHKDKRKVMGTTTLVIEYKFIRDCTKRARIEDVIVDESVRGIGLGKKLVTIAVNVAYQQKCYKVSLDCKDKTIPFYQSLGFHHEANMMAIRFGGKPPIGAPEDGCVTEYESS